MEVANITKALVALQGTITDYLEVIEAGAASMDPADAGQVKATLLDLNEVVVTEVARVGDILVPPEE